MAKKETSARTIDIFKQELKAGVFRNLYILWGEETYLLQHYVQELHKKVVDPLTEEFNYHRFSSETFTVDELWRSVENLPMLSERSMVRVDDVNLFKLSEQDREKLTELLRDLPDYCTLVFVYGASEYTPDRRQKKLFDAIDKNALVVEFALQSRRELVAWTSRAFKRYNKTISSELCGYLISITGGTMTALATEISKVASYASDVEIRKTDIDAMVEPVLDAVVFDMTDALGEGDHEKAMSLLQELFKMQQEPIVILGAISKHLRHLSSARILMEAGKNSDDLMRLCGLKDYPARKTMSAAKRISNRLCRRAAELVLETDLHMKTSYDDRQRLLEMLLMKLAQEMRHD